MEVRGEEDEERDEARENDSLLETELLHEEDREGVRESERVVQGVGERDVEGEITAVVLPSLEGVGDVERLCFNEKDPDFEGRVEREGMGEGEEERDEL